MALINVKYVKNLIKHLAEKRKKFETHRNKLSVI